MRQMKMATCCYCGSRTTLVLAGEKQHELACGSCGAPLSQMKMLPAGQASAPERAPARPARPASSHDRWAKKGKAKTKRKGFGWKIAEELFDAIEDILD